MTKRRLILIAALASIFVLFLFAQNATKPNAGLQIKTVTESENQIALLAEQFSQLKGYMASTINSDEATQASEKLFSTQFDYQGLENSLDLNALSFKSSEDNLRKLAYLLNLPVQESHQNAAKPDSIWSELRRGKDSAPNKDAKRVILIDGQFGILKGEFISSSRFLTNTKFEGRVIPDPQNTNGTRILGIKAYQSIEFKKNEEQWQVCKWTQTKFELIASGGFRGSGDTVPPSLFQDVTAVVIPDQATLQKVQSSSHQELILQKAKIKAAIIKPVSFRHSGYNDWESAYQYPGVSVVDYDNDGLDDLFVTDRWQPAQLLRNQGDGTFADVTEESGLLVKDLAVCALFADFDNDGDADAFIGRSLESCLYFKNNNGKFSLEKSFSDRHMKFVVSGSVVDINNDGLLDLYLNTYGFSTDDSVWQTDTYREQDRMELEDRSKNQHWFLNRGGAPNIVLLNNHGKLERVEVDDTLAQWRNSYQTVWSDFDSDGDPDLYICNDFAPDCFLRNDTDRGSAELQFTDVSQELLPDGVMGFGMGASWGDYNNDGRLDLYVSNMYSKAGNRIVSQIDDVNEKIKVASQGNFLYENVGSTFTQVAGLGEDVQHVSKVGWSFGGQFADFDNDGDLDIYVPSGFYTPPPELQTPGDL